MKINDGTIILVLVELAGRIGARLAQETGTLMAMNQKFVGSSIFLVSFFFVFLGMRIVDLGGNLQGKQRPRAVIESQAKESQEVCKKQMPDAEPCRSISTPVSTPGFVSPNREIPRHSYLAIVTVPSRAPPSVIS